MSCYTGNFYAPLVSSDPRDEFRSDMEEALRVSAEENGVQPDEFHSDLSSEYDSNEQLERVTR